MTQPMQESTEEGFYFATHKVYGYRAVVKASHKNSEGEWLVKEKDVAIHFNFYKDYCGPLVDPLAEPQR